MTWIKKIALPAVVIFAVLLLWQLALLIGVFQSSFMPSPVQVLLGIAELIQKGDLLDNVFASLFRVFVGFALAALIAIPAGLLFGAYAIVKDSFNPLVQILRTISPIAWIPLAILWFGIGDTPAIFIIFITAFFPLFIAVYSGVKQVDPVLIKAARNLGAEGRTLIRKVLFPAALPHIVAGLRISLGISWVIIVAAEMVGMRSGLGYLILDSRNFLRIDLVIGVMIVIGLIGLCMDAVLTYFEHSVKRRWAFNASMEGY